MKNANIDISIDTNIDTSVNTNINKDTNTKNIKCKKIKTSNIQKKDYYEEITNKISKALENNIRPWIQPWDGGILPIPMRHNNTPYQGINMTSAKVTTFCRHLGN